MLSDPIGGSILVPGQPCAGAIARSPVEGKSGQIFLAENLQPSDYAAVVRSSAVICEEGGRLSHLSVICRTLGIPVLLLEHAADRLHDGEPVLVDCLHGELLRGEATEDDLASRAEALYYPTLGDTTLQISITEPAHIRAVADTPGPRIEQFSLRAEFLWTRLNVHPFAFLEREGLYRTADRLADELQEYVACLQPGQRLNFRSLDMRTDEFAGLLETSHLEPNPQLGMHGIRRLLMDTPLLIAELMAMDAVLSRDYDNVVFSIPFVTDDAEVMAVLTLMHKHCSHRIPLGVFIEVPAALYQLEEILDLGTDEIYIGTKDLTQLLLACDRSNKNLLYKCSLTHPAVLKAINHALKVCAAREIPAYVFTTLEDLERYQQQLSPLDRVSLCFGDYTHLRAAATDTV